MEKWPINFVAVNRYIVLLGDINDLLQLLALDYGPSRVLRIAK